MILYSYAVIFTTANIVFCSAHGAIDWIDNSMRYWLMIAVTEVRNNQIFLPIITTENLAYRGISQM